MYDLLESRFSHAPLMNSRRSGMSFSTVVDHRFGLYSNTRNRLAGYSVFIISSPVTQARAAASLAGPIAIIF